jgi:hypothetical protein
LSKKAKSQSPYTAALDKAFKGKPFSEAVDAGVKVAKRLGRSAKRSTIGIYFWRYKDTGSTAKHGAWTVHPKKSKWLSETWNKGAKGKKAKKGKPAKAPKKAKRVSPKAKARKMHDAELSKASRVGVATGQKTPAQVIADSNPAQAVA